MEEDNDYSPMDIDSEDGDDYNNDDNSTNVLPKEDEVLKQELHTDSEDGDDYNSDDNSTNVLPKENEVLKQEQHTLATVTGWLLTKTGKTRVRDINPWEGFISPWRHGEIERSPHEYKKDTDDMKRKAEQRFSDGLDNLQKMGCY